MPEGPVETIGTKYIRQIQQQKLELTLLKAQLDAALRDRDAARDEARAQSASLLILLEALVGSLRPYGFRRRTFLAAIRQAARAIPADGPEALQHRILFDGTNTVLDRAGGRSRAVLAARPS